MDRVRERHASLRNHVVQARRRVEQRERRAGQMPLAAATGVERDLERAGWLPGASVIALLFGHPDADAIRTLDTRGDYFDVRSGDTWDLFFPGYYTSARGPHFEHSAGSRPIGGGFADDWYFSATDFNTMRREVEERSERQWQYSGGTDLVLITVLMPEEGEPIVDWASTAAGQITESAEGLKSLALGGVVERISRDLEHHLEDPSYGVGDVVGPDNADGSPSPYRDLARDVLVEALGGIAAAVASRSLGP